MLGIEDYGSGSDSDSDHKLDTPIVKRNTQPGAQKSTFSLPPPTSGISLPKPKRGPKKITIGLPKLTTPQDDEDDDLKDERPAVKRPRLEAGAGRSSLLSLLPTPSEKNPAPPPPERVLGGGKGPGLVFRTSEPRRATSFSAGESEDPASSAPAAPMPFIPPFLKRGRANISVEGGKPKVWSQPTAPKASPPAVDFFSLGASSSTPQIGAPSASRSSSVSYSRFEPPEPSQTDEYPGYYQLQSGAWAAHDPVYYAKFVKKWQDDYNAHVRALEKGMVKGFEGLETAAVEEVNAMKEMEKAKREIKDREDRKAVTQGTDRQAKLVELHDQGTKLSTLLKEAYENREALEDKIAQGKRNRKEAGNKYGV
ncbi:mitotic checkpoint regulator, MAD2B-interacting-domain-containing protein [Lyophyllum atratum]|nr:mitotic checkpoint regulator, MAD2B-interacting-domain-containing protein [Lyophyllum atratum]